MSMIMSLAALSPTLVTELKARPDLTWELALDPAMDVQRAEMGYPVDRQLGESPAAFLSLYKDWHVMHYTLTGSARGGELPLGFLMSGTEIGENHGYGPSRLLDAGQVAEVSQAIAVFDIGGASAALSLDGLRQNEIYGVPFGMTIEEVRSDLVMPTFAQLREFLRAAAGNDHAILIGLV